MEVAHSRFVRHHVTTAETGELTSVDRLASQLREHLVLSSSVIDAVHVHQARSAAVQSIARNC